MSNWVLSVDKKIVLENFIRQQVNRIGNFEAIKSKLVSEDYNFSQLENLLMADRIEIHKSYAVLPELRLHSRIILLATFRRVINYRDLLILVFGVRALIIIATLKRARMRLSSKKGG